MKTKDDDVNFLLNYVNQILDEDIDLSVDPSSNIENNKSKPIKWNSEFDKPIEWVGRPIIDEADITDDDYQIEPKDSFASIYGEIECPTWYTTTKDYFEKLQKNFGHDSTTELFLEMGGKYKLIQGHGFGFSPNDPIGYFRIDGESKLQECLYSLIPDVGEEWRLNSCFRVEHYKNGVDKYVVLYTGYVDGVYVGYIYELYFWRYYKGGIDKSGYMGACRLPYGFKSNYNSESLLNREHNLYGNPAVYLRYQFNQRSDDYLDDPLEKIGRPIITKKAMLNGIAQLLPGQNPPDLPKSKETAKPKSYEDISTWYHRYCRHVRQRQIDGDIKYFCEQNVHNGYGYSVEDPVGYMATLGLTRADEYFNSIVPNEGEKWELFGYFRVCSYANGVDEYVVVYHGRVNGKEAVYMYNLFLWMYDQKGFPNNLMGIYRVPHGLMPNPNEWKFANKTLYNAKHNLYGKTPAEPETAKKIITIEHKLEQGMANEYKINDQEILAVLENFEKNHYDEDGYNIGSIMDELGIYGNLVNADKIHTILCKMIDKKIYPKIKVAGDKNIVFPIFGNKEGTRIYTFGLVKYRIQGEVILGEWVRKNTVDLYKLAKPGVCKCWVDRKTFENILQYANLSFDDIKDNTEICQGRYCVYVGCTDDMEERIKQHVTGSLSSSGFKRNLSAILKDKDLLEEIINGVNFECIATEHGEQVKENFLKMYQYILYKGN